MEDILDETSVDYNTILEKTNNFTEDLLNLSRINSSTQKKFDEDPMKEVTLEMIYLEIREIKSNLSSKIDRVFLEFKKENTALKKEIDNLKTDLKTKSEVIGDLKHELDILIQTKTDDDHVGWKAAKGV